MQFVEVKLTQVVDTLSIDGEQQSCGPEPCSIAIRTSMLHHHFVQPGLHPGTGFASLTVAPVVAFNSAGNASEPDLLGFGTLHV